MIFRFIELNINSIADTARRHKFALILNEGKPQFALLCKTRLIHRYKLTFPNYNLLKTDRFQQLQPGFTIAGGTAVLISDRYMSTQHYPLMGSTLISIDAVSTTVYITAIYSHSHQTFGSSDLSSFCCFQPREVTESWATIVNGDLNTKYPSWFNQNPDFNDGQFRRCTTHLHPQPET